MQESASKFNSLKSNAEAVWKRAAFESFWLNAGYGAEIQCIGVQSSALQRTETKSNAGSPSRRVSQVALTAHRKMVSGIS